MPDDENDNSDDNSGPQAAGGNASAYGLCKVEVQFRDGTRPKVDASGAGCQFTLAGAGYDASETDGINTYLAEQGCIKAEPVFEKTPEEFEEVKRLAEDAEVEIADLDSFYVLHFPEGADVQAIASRLREEKKFVKRASALPYLKSSSPAPFTPPVDSLVKDQWYITRCRVDKVWERGFTGDGVVVAGIDSGFQLLHPDFPKGRFNLERAFNALTGDNQLSKKGRNLQHGTAVMGLVGAATAGKGMVGIAHGAELWPIEVSVDVLPSAFTVDGVLVADPFAWVKAIEEVTSFVRREKRRVVIVVEADTFHDGNVTQIAIIRTAIRLAIIYGAVVCVPAGNGDRKVSEYDPKTVEEARLKGEVLEPFKPVGVIVGATLKDDRPFFVEAEFGTNFGDAVVVSAPGDPGDDLTCNHVLDEADPSKNYTKAFGGTSGATAKVAAAVALMLQANGDLRHADVVEILRHTGTPIDSPRKPIGRLLDCESAVWVAEHYTAKPRPAVEPAPEVVIEPAAHAPGAGFGAAPGPA